jgi:dUTP pyrophosphatase
MNKVEIKLLNESAKLPKKGHDDDFCYDLVATSVEEVAPNVYKYGTGIALQFDKHYSDICSQNGVHNGFNVRPRSSIWKTGMVLSNSIGTIDKGYTGEIMLVFYHVMPNMPKYELGDRIGQLHLDFSQDMHFVIVDSFEETERGNNGYGSTGK